MMLGLGKCSSCENKGICKYIEKMKEYEEGVSNVVGKHTHNFGDFPLSINVNCSMFKANTGVIRAGNANTEVGLEYGRHEIPDHIHNNIEGMFLRNK